MQLTTTLSPKLEFARRAMIPRDLERRLIDEENRKRADKKERDEERNEAELLDLMMAIPATETQVAEFNVMLDQQDAATVQALMDNEQELKAVTERIDQALSQAIVLPDGRRVFKTQDGQKVFDEFGVQVAADVIDPDMIPDEKRRFEPYIQDRTDKLSLTQERELLQEHLTLLDDSRDTGAEKKVAATTLDELTADIKASTPDRVRQILDQNDNAKSVDLVADVEAFSRPAPTARAAPGIGQP